MRRVRYRVVSSLDGYIAGPHGELDWIVSDPEADPSGIYKEIDTVLLGRKTYELTLQPGAPPWPVGWRVFVFSTTLSPDKAHPVTVVAKGAEATVRQLRAEDGKDIWLFGGAGLFRSLLQAGLVDTVEISVMPVVLGGGLPLVEPGAPRTTLRLTDSTVHPSGIASLSYDVQPVRRS